MPEVWDYGTRWTPAWGKLRAAWEHYYLTRGVSQSRVYELAVSKANRGLQVPL